MFLAEHLRNDYGCQNTYQQNGHHQLDHRKAAGISAAFDKPHTYKVPPEHHFLQPPVNQLGRDLLGQIKPGGEGEDKAQPKSQQRRALSAKAQLVLRSEAGKETRQLVAGRMGFHPGHFMT